MMSASTYVLPGLQLHACCPTWLHERNEDNSCSMHCNQQQFPLSCQAKCVCATHTHPARLLTSLSR
jgi:hypothetical protein